LIFGFWNKFGKGRALYLGFLNNRYLSVEKDFTSVFPLFASVLKRAGVKPPVGLSTGAGQPLKSFTVNHFADDGVLRYTGILKRDAQAPAKVVLDYGRPGHYYEVMTTRYLGAGDTVEVDLASNQPVQAGMPTLAGTLIEGSEALTGMALVARLDYKMGKVKIRATRSGPGENLPVEVSVLTAEGEPAQKHVLYLTVLDPQGRVAEPYCQNVVTADGTWRGSLPLALNEKRGKWTLRVREAITGTTAITRVVVK